MWLWDQSEFKIQATGQKKTLNIVMFGGQNSTMVRILAYGPSCPMFESRFWRFFLERIMYCVIIWQRTDLQWTVKSLIKLIETIQDLAGGKLIMQKIDRLGHEWESSTAAESYFSLHCFSPSDMTSSAGNHFFWRHLRPFHNLKSFSKRIFNPTPTPTPTPTQARTKCSRAQSRFFCRKK